MPLSRVVAGFLSPFFIKPLCIYHAKLSFGLSCWSFSLYVWSFSSLNAWRGLVMCLLSTSQCSSSLYYVPCPVHWDYYCLGTVSSISTAARCFYILRTIYLWSWFAQMLSKVPPNVFFSSSWKSSVIPWWFRVLTLLYCSPMFFHWGFLVESSVLDLYLVSGTCGLLKFRWKCVDSSISITIAPLASVYRISFIVVICSWDRRWLLLKRAPPVDSLANRVVEVCKLMLSGSFVS